MKTNSFTFPINLSEELSDGEFFCRRKALWTFVVGLTTFAGILFGISGEVLSLTAYFERGAHHDLNSRLGGFLLLTMFPMLFLAADALDRVAFYKRKIKENSTSCIKFSSE